MSKDTFYTLAPLNWLLRCTGLSNVYRKENCLAESGSLAKSLIFTFGLFFFNMLYAYLKVVHFRYGYHETGILKFNHVIQFTYFIPYAGYVIDMIMVYKQNRLKLLEHFKAFDYIDSILGVPLYDEIRNFIFNCLLVSMIVYFFTSIFDCVTWMRLEGYVAATLYSIDYLYFFLTMLTMLDIVTHVIQVEYRLKLVVGLLQNCNSVNFMKHVTVVSAEEKNDKKTLNSLNAVSYTRHLEAAWFHKCYLLLLDRVSYLNDTYGFRVLVYCVNLLINMIYLLNLVMRIVNGTLCPYYGNDSITTYLPCVTGFLRALNYAIMVAILMYCCEQNYKQNDKILETIDMLLFNQNIHINLKTNLLEFRNLIITRPIKFHAAKFVNMDYTLLVSLTSVVVTYTIIILQSIQ